MADTQIVQFRSILSYCVFIILGPIFTFFVTKIIFFEGLLQSTSVASNVWSAVAAILVLHVALGMFIMRAYNDANKVKSSKDDKVD